MSSYLAHKRKGFQGAAPSAFNGFGNRSRSFDGVDNHVSIPDFEHSLTNLSCMCWIKSTDSTYKSFFSHWDDNSNRSWLIQLDATDGLLCAVKDGADADYKIFYAPDAQDTIADGTWHHVGFTFASNDLRLYIDGLRVPSERISNFGDDTVLVIKNSTANILIGADIASSVPANFVNANIADCRIYDATLTGAEMADIYNGTNITTNLVGHWLTDADDTEDKAGSNNGTNYGSKYSYDNPSPPVEFGSASRSFNGSSDYVNLGQTTDNAIFTASAWVKFNSNNSLGEGIFGKWQIATNGAWLLYTQSTSNYLTFIVRNSANDAYTICSSDIVPTLGQWTHIAGVADGTNLTIYINGVSAASIAYDGTINNPTSDTNIGAYNNTINNNHHVDGKIADARIYDTDLSASQISDLYSGTDVQTNLVGHWLTDNDDVEDKAGTNDGTNFGSTYDYDAPFTEVTLPNHFWNLSDTGTYADSGKLASAGWDLNEFSSVSSSVQSIGTSTKTVLDTTSGGVLEYKNGASVDVGWDSESKEISMACWFYCDSISSSGNWLISWRGNNTDNKIAQLFIRNDGGLQILRGGIFDAQSDSVLTPQSGTSISLNTWYHGALTWDHTTLKVYIDGELFASATNASVDGFGTNTSGCEFAIAGGSWDKNGPSVHHKGYTFGAGVWDVALTENQIKALYNDGNALDYSETTWR